MFRLNNNLSILLLSNLLTFMFQGIKVNVVSFLSLFFLLHLELAHFPYRYLRKVNCKYQISYLLFHEKVSILKKTNLTKYLFWSHLLSQMMLVFLFLLTLKEQSSFLSFFTDKFHLLIPSVWVWIFFVYFYIQEL